MRSSVAGTAQFKVLLLGNSAVGKTSVLQQLISNQFSPQYKATIGVDSRDKKFTLEGKSVVLTIWDTAGQEKFADLSSFYFRGCDGVVFVYDVGAPETLRDIRKWHAQLMKNVDLSPDFPLFLIGNKCDARRETQLADADRLVEELKLSRHELVSAKTGVNVESVFRQLAAHALKNKPQVEQMAENFRISMGDTSNDVEKPPKRKKCCE